MRACREHSLQRLQTLSYVLRQMGSPGTSTRSGCERKQTGRSWLAATVTTAPVGMRPSKRWASAAWLTHDQRAGMLSAVSFSAVKQIKRIATTHAMPLHAPLPMRQQCYGHDTHQQDARAIRLPAASCGTRTGCPPIAGAGRDAVDQLRQDASRHRARHAPPPTPAGAATAVTCSVLLSAQPASERRS